MKGRLKKEHWYVYRDMPGSDFFTAERWIDGKSQREHISTHCMACAKTEILAMFGGKVDTRGWHKQGLCGAFLRGMADTVDAEE